MVATAVPSTIRVAVIGAGGPMAVEQLFQSLPPRCGFAIVVACPAEPALAARLRPRAPMPVIAARGTMALEPDQIYIVPADCEAAFQRGELVVAAMSARPAPIDRLLRSLADDVGALSAGVILGGLGNDGVIGIKRLKEVGGLTIVQTPDGDADMSRTSIATGAVDMVLDLPEIGPRLAELARDREDETPATDEADRRGQDTSSDALRDILAMVRIRFGHDFSSYKRATLYRRVSRRMQVCQCESIAAYYSYLRERPNELGHLLRDFLISVTNFFRDRSAFDALASSVIPKLFAGKGADDQVRVWVAGCATGEEAYSIGILLCEHAGKLHD
ncbi:MAG TPA: chemotaxis protein CheB, partial [Kofleriaceae bacterium]|nr:chemotaxis protein CheB [Kofleriaceae bacterium]